MNEQDPSRKQGNKEIKKEGKETREVRSDEMVIDVFDDYCKAVSSASYTLLKMVATSTSRRKR